MIRRYSILLIALIGFGALSACNTMEGIGKDIKGAGGAIEEKAAKTKSGDDAK